MKSIQYRVRIWPDKEKGIEDHMEEREISGSDLHAAIPYATPENMAEIFCRWANSYWRNAGTDAREFGIVVAREHRTLQQTVVGFLFRILTEYGRATRETGHDARNEAATKLCQQIVLQVETGLYSEYMPLI